MNSYLREAPNGQFDIEYYDCVKFLSGIRVNRILQPQRTILLYEGIPRTREFEDKAYTEDQIAYIYRCANWTWARGYYDKYTHTIDSGRPWHVKVNNYLYADGMCWPPGKKVEYRPTVRCMRVCQQGAICKTANFRVEQRPAHFSTLDLGLFPDFVNPT